MIIAVDFDGTLVEHKYPEIGPEVPFAFEVLNKIQDAGHKIILYTMRSGEELDDAVKYVESQGIKLYGINCNPKQSEWTNSPKVHADIYIDDRAFGCPLSRNIFDQVYVNWLFIDQMVFGRPIQIQKAK